MFIEGEGGRRRGSPRATCCYGVLCFDASWKDHNRPRGCGLEAAEELDHV